MKRSDWGVVVGVAAVTFLAAMATWLSLPVAVAEQTKPVLPAGVPVPAKRALEADGVTLSLELDKATAVPGKKPRVVLVAKNATTDIKGIDVTVRLTSQTPASRMSRMVIMPKPVWHTLCSVMLKPGEVRRTTLEVDKTVAKGMSYTFTLQHGKQSVMAAQFPEAPVNPKALDLKAGGGRQ